MNHLNKNGLVAGNIPAGHACPFIAHCKFKVTRCPTEKKLHTQPYSCGAARLHSMVVDLKAHSPIIAKAVADVIEPPTNYTSTLTIPPFNGGDVVIIDDDGYTD